MHGRICQDLIIQVRKNLRKAVGGLPVRTTASRDTFAWRDAGLPREIAIVCGAKRKGRVIEMLVSTKGRYALRLMVCVAQAGAEGKVALREVSEREDISLKYLEQLARPLVQAGLLRSVRGKGGGYALAQEPAAIRAGDVLRAVEGSTAPVACLDLQEGMACPRAGECTTVRFWAGLDEVIERYVDGVTLADLAGEPGLPSLPAI